MQSTEASVDSGRLSEHSCRAWCRRVWGRHTVRRHYDEAVFGPEVAAAISGRPGGPGLLADRAHPSLAVTPDKL